jgi:hypothetical protein
MKEGSKHTPEAKQKQREKMLKTLNAEYWTEELVQSTLFDMIEFLNKDYTIEVSVKNKEGEKSGGKGDFEYSETSKDTVKEKKKRRHHTKVTVLQNFDILNFNWFSDMRAKFKDNETISLMLQAITEICENNVYNDAANGAVNAGVANLLLMTKHNWKAKTENDNKNANLDVVVKLPEPDEEAKQRWEDSQIKDT